MAGNVALPFFGPDPLPWQRPSLATFSTWLNQGNQPTAVEIVAAGIGNYAPNDVVTFGGGTFTKAATVNIRSTKVVSASIVNGGHSGTPGPAQVIGTTAANNFGNCVLNVTINGSGVISSIDSIDDPGEYHTTNPTDPNNEPVDDNSGSGITGAIVHLVLGIGSIFSGKGGAYSAVPGNPVSQGSSSGTGTGATFNVTWSALASAADNSGGLPMVIQAVQKPLFNGNSSYVYVTGRLKPLGAGPWIVTAAAVSAFVQPGGQGACVPILLYDDVSGEAIALWWLNETNTLSVYHFADGIEPYASNSDIPFTAAIPGEYFMWFRIEHDGTNLIYSMSSEGVVFLEVGREAANVLGVDFNHVGFGLSAGTNGTPGHRMSGIWNWVES